ncbi:Caspase-like domain-containing protein [Desulfonema limicola]|uniref:Caspase-like domain-containing protein n=1 Tax=Desulfonema limicola TaxID=45656 RepID=A0A975GF40_9BACT|nr:caspase family protein [Desulfonema limicola]QTA78795.1 Caspase-like domain-containing protein [Desulfonema limicola]
MFNRFLYKLSYLSLILLFFGILFAGCQPLSENMPVKKDGKVYGITDGAFRHRWWNYYERGVSFMAGEFWIKAEKDFRAAIAQWDNDQRRIRTYGRHLINYFPHRELGVSLFHQKKYLEAIHELEASISSEKTAKAQYYLDKVRKVWIEQEYLDKHPPQIKLSLSGHTTLSNQFKINVHGKATDDTFVKEISVNGEPVRIDLSQPVFEFNNSVSLKPGKNSIIAEVQDITGKTVTEKMEIFCDRTGPILNIDSLLQDGIEHYILKGYAHDQSGIREIRVNGIKLPDSSGMEISLNHRLSFSGSIKTAEIMAEDMAGNKTFGKIKLNPADNIDFSGNISNSLLFASRQLNTASDARGIMNPEKRMKKIKKTGNYYALLIGINKYETWPELKNAVNDVSELKNILISKYGFLPENVKLKTDSQATWASLVEQMKNMAEKLGDSDNLLIYFAGHGQLDSLTGDGYWIPTDGSPDDQSTWITNSSIKLILGSNTVKARNILVIADSCYSGTLLYPVSFYVNSGISFSGNDNKSLIGMRGKPKKNSLNNARTSYSDSGNNLHNKILELAYRRSRQIIASGGIEPVKDSGGNEHSLFAHYLLKALKENNRQAIDIEYLYNTSIFKPITDKGGQRPVLGRLKTEMDQGGQYVLIMDSKFRQSYLSKDSGESASSGTKEMPDIYPPDIKIRGWNGTKTVYIDKAFLELNVNDSSGIKQVTINKEKILKRPGRNLHLNYLVSLKSGENIFHVICIDQLGNRSEKKIIIFRKIPKVFETGARMSVALFPLDIQGENDFGAQGLFRSHLDESKRFNLKQINTYKNETPLNAARSQEAEFVLSGTITSQNNSLNIVVQIIDTKDSFILTTQDVYGENPDLQQIRYLCKGLAVKICDELPLLEGKVLKIKGKDILLSLGEKHGIKKGMQLIFFQENEPIIDPDTGNELGADADELGIARIQKLMPKYSYSKLVNSNDMDMLESGMRFVMK